MKPMTTLAGEVFTVKEYIDPEMAREYLSTMGPNRRINRRRMKLYKDIILRDEWELTHQGIAFDSNGQLIDGQHRLMAIVQTGVTLPMLVTRGLAPGSQRAVDGGLLRGNRDQLDILNIEQAADLAPALAVLYRLFLADQMPIRERRFNKNVSPTKAEVEAMVYAHPEMARFLEVGRRLGKTIGVPKSVMSGVRYYLGLLDEGDADVFFEYLATGEELQVGHPVYVLREQFRRMVLNAAKRGGRVDYAKTAALTIRAWNAYRGGKSPSSFNWTPNAPFPNPR